MLLNQQNYRKIYFDCIMYYNNAVRTPWDSVSDLLYCEGITEFYGTHGQNCDNNEGY